MASGRLWTRSSDQQERTRSAAESAVARAPNLPESHVALAMIRYQASREPDAMVSLKRALRLSRFNAEAHDMVGRILAETALSFLGIGLQPPIISWGVLLQEAQNIRAVAQAPWLLFTPAAAIVISVLSLNFLGDGLRDAADPYESVS